MVITVRGRYRPTLESRYDLSLSGQQLASVHIELKRRLAAEPAASFQPNRPLPARLAFMLEMNSLPDTATRSLSASQRVPHALPGRCSTHLRASRTFRKTLGVAVICRHNTPFLRVGWWTDATQ